MPTMRWTARHGVWLHPVRLAQLLVCAAVITTALGTVYYYNLFVDLEQDVRTAVAQIDRELQRRADLTQNLLPAVFEYAALERHVFTEVAKVRAQMAGVANDGASKKLGKELGKVPGVIDLKAKLAAAGTDPFGEVLKRLVAVSEQYPDMKSSAPFTMLMEKVVEIEDRLAEERKKYNDCVNYYTTLSASFPGALFAQIFSFERHELFSAEPEARARPVVGWPLTEP